jgi:hypothetical protein
LLTATVRDGWGGFSWGIFGGLFSNLVKHSKKKELPKLFIYKGFEISQG